MTDPTLIEAIIYAWVPYPREISDRINAENAAAKAALADFPDHATTLIRVSETADAKAFVDALDFQIIRDKFRRAAKKIGLHLPEDDFPVGIFIENFGVRLSARARTKQ